jgi:uncharacterized protein YbjT (DUF2867 family)
MSKTILVTGATGSQGGAAAHELLKMGHTVRAATRHPDSEKATTLKDAGATIVTADFDDPASLEAAARGTDAVFAMGTPYEAGTETETRQSLAVIDAAKKAGTRHIVYTSVSDADRDTGIPHFDSKYVVEQHLAGLDVPYTILAPVWFMENALGPFYRPELAKGRLPLPMPADHPLQQVAVENVGQVAAAVIHAGEPYYGKRINLAGDELSGSAMAKTIADAAGKPITYVALDLDAFRKANDDWGRMFDWFVRVGYSADIQGLRRDLPKIGWLTFADWCKKQDWSAITPLR